MAQSSPNQELVDRFAQFYRNYYRDEISRLAQRYPNEQRSLHVDYDDLYQFDPDLAEDYLSRPDEFRDFAEEALRVYDLPADVSLGQAHVRLRNLPESVDIRSIRVHDDHVGRMIAVSGIVRKATDVRPKIVKAAFECQRCGTMTHIPQSDGSFQEPHDCQGCERQGPFRVNYDQSEFVDSQKLRVQESPEGLRGGETPQSIDIDIEDDITGKVTAGDHVTVTGVLHIDQVTEGNEKSQLFDLYMDGVSVEIEDEQFEDMEIDEADKREIIELSNHPDIYEEMVASVAPSIYGYDEEKLAMILQLFSGVTKHLPDGSRIRGDLHMLLIGDPGTGKSQLLSYIRNIAPRSVYTSGKGSSSAGLTAAAVRDDFGEGQQWSLEAGALVLADQGIAAVDELDKMRCVTGDTLVHLADGSIRRIEEVARDAAETGTVEELDNGRTIREVDFDAWTMTDDGRIVSRPVTAVHEYEAPTELTEVRLETGERLTATDDHPFFVFEDGERVERAASDLSTDDWVYVPRALPQSATDGGSTTVDSTTSQKGAVDQANDELSPAFGSILGYLSGDGNVFYDREHGSYGIRFTNAEEELLADFERACREAFDAEPIRAPSEQRADGVETVRLSGRDYADAVLEAGMNLRTYDEKSFPEGLSDASRTTKAAFVRALADSEGTVDTQTGNVRVYSASYELLLGTKHLLLEFGISSQLQTREHEDRRDLHVLAITSADSIRAFERHVGFVLDRKASSLETVRTNVGGDRTILDVIPECGDLLADLRESLRLYQSECGIGDTTYCNFENDDANVSLRLGREILDAFEQRREMASTDLAELTATTGWETLEELRERYHVSQTELASMESETTQQEISRNWGLDPSLRSTISNNLRAIVSDVAQTDLSSFRELVSGDVKWRRVSDVTATVADADDDRIVQLEHDLADRLGCDETEAVERARQLLSDNPDPETWNEIRELAERYDISLDTIADDLDVDASTLSRWTRSVISTDRFDDVRTVTLDQIENVRRDLREIVEEIDDREGQSRVYDLTVDGTHNFVANGMVVHNSEDRSAMHQALEQQSYHPSSEILLADGRRVEIGEFVDGAMADRPDEVVDGVNCDILPVDEIGVHSVDFETNEVEKQPVDRVSRHEAPDEFVRVTFSNGRSVLVTPEHPMFVEQDGETTTVEASGVEAGSFVPAPRKLPNSTAGVSLDGEPHRGKEKDVDLPDELTPDLAEILGLLVAEGHSYAGSSHEIGFSNQDERLLDRMERLMHDVFGMTSSDTTNAAGTVTQQYISTKLYRWFESNVPEVMHTARGKRIPAAVLGASEEAIRRFLVGAFAGDGGVESEAMSFSTASEGLAEDYADALAKLGVASRTHHDTCENAWKTYVMGDSTARFVDAVVEPADDRYAKAREFVERSEATKRHHDVLPPSAAAEIRSLRRLLGLRLTGELKPNLDEAYGVQIETVERHVETLRDRLRAVRSALDEADTLADVRAAVDWSGRQLAERLDDETTSAVHYAEDGGYDAERRAALATAAREAVSDALDDATTRLDALEARCALRYYRIIDVETVPNAGEYACDYVYDVTVEPTNTFVSQGVALHNSISISKAGINATLKSRCSLLGAANPKYGRFDQYEPIGEQIDLEPALISRFDLIFTVTDQPDPDEDAALAEHILRTNYAGELETQRTKVANSNHTAEEVAEVTDTVDPEIDPDLLRKYIAYAKRTCFPTMTDEAKEAIRDFYVDLRAKGADEDAPVPVTARKLEALVRLAEASARVRLSDTVERADAERVIDIVRSCLQDIGVDPETGEFDADVIETGTSKTQRDRIKSIKDVIETVDAEYEKEAGAPIDAIVERAEAEGIEESKVMDQIEQLRRKGDLYSPKTDQYKVV
jgi:replicative DNA helicase Mcm